MSQFQPISSAIDDITVYEFDMQASQQVSEWRLPTELISKKKVGQVGQIFKKIAQSYFRPNTPAAIGAIVSRPACLQARRVQRRHHATRYLHDCGNGSNLAQESTSRRRQTPADSRINHADRSKILHNTRVSRHHLAPEIALHLITPECTIYHEPIGDDFCFAAEPFWGFFWPGGQALTRYILDNKSLFAGKNVLDIGCGCGASSIAAKLAGANRVTANDIDETALQATLLNAELNAVTAGLDVSSQNQIGQPVRDGVYDVLLIGDLFYDAEIANVLMPWLYRLTASRKSIYIGDPGRHGLVGTKLKHMTQLARYELPPNVCIENNGFSHANVWEFTGGEAA
ncbi:electron transfer flavoprotein beta subunit lysine methyltransferase-like [Toxorhynchites rutilus septentrionalis]|uniref:electron transfer flavoprotein beta subunit lysine methyltransferase-like n=1 Tax=Toxorhynchites rutilus septentrionalis TaxID=329112 RepID=UPI00247887DB|nr:electron transfer flavoprotein beta subunit lysine methyltransferase-like [Toxorhynchites rutilus septentrionalis]